MSCVLGDGRGGGGGRGGHWYKFHFFLDQGSVSRGSASLISKVVVQQGFFLPDFLSSGLNVELVTTVFCYSAINIQLSNCMLILLIQPMLDSCSSCGHC